MENRDQPRFDGGLWRIWDGQEVIGVHDQPWIRESAKVGSEKALQILRGEVTTDLLGSTRTYRITRVGDDEFDLIKSKHYGFY